jgi:hypothetical protein
MGSFDEPVIGNFFCVAIPFFIFHRRLREPLSLLHSIYNVEDWGAKAGWLEQADHFMNYGMLEYSAIGIEGVARIKMVGNPPEYQLWEAIHRKTAFDMPNVDMLKRH